jgi:alpha-glucan phosphorylase-like protein
MTVLALRTTAAANGVSALHGHVSRVMWHDLWPKLDVDQVTIGHVTNGVHPTAWMAPEAQQLFDRYVGGWREHIWDPEVWAAVDDIPDEALWSMRSALRRRLAEGIAQRAGRSFDPEALTIGFARRFAPYKRGNLLFRDLPRLKAILDRVPVQLVFAGKAHPRDVMGQDIVAEVIKHSEHRDFRDRVVLLQDYDIQLGRLVTSGSDVWLNNPRRPHEASGTSGQKVVLNGGINLSVLDGWWPEAYDGTNGWAIGAGEERPDAEQDALDAEALYRTLEESVLPEWTDREGGLPKKWIARMRRSIRTCIPLFSSHRMVRDYALEMYAPRCR